MLNLTYFLRKPSKEAWSLENVYAEVEKNLPDDIKVTAYPNRFRSQGILFRVFDMIRASLHQGDVNHITGDVHYLTYLLSRKRTILTIHDCAMVEHSQGLKRFLLWLFWIWLPEKRCTAIVAISEATKREIQKHVACQPEKIKVIYNPISPMFQPSSKIFNASCPRILHVGITPNKNLDRHIAAIIGMTCEFVIIGVLSEVQRAALSNSGVRYTMLSGLSDQEMVAQYQRCDLLLFASTYEGFGLPIVEAQAVGRPVITSRLYSMPEVAGEAACLVDPYDVESIRAGIHKIVHEDEYRNQLVQKGFINSQRFSVDAIADQYAALYRNVAQNATPK